MQDLLMPDVNDNFIPLSGDNFIQEPLCSSIYLNETGLGI